MEGLRYRNPRTNNPSPNPPIHGPSPENPPTRWLSRGVTGQLEYIAKDGLGGAVSRAGDVGDASGGGGGIVWMGGGRGALVRGGGGEGWWEVEVVRIRRR